MLNQLIEIPEGIIGDQQTFTLRAFNFLIDQNSCSLRLQGFLIIFWMIDKNNITGLHFVNFIHARYKMMGRAFKFCIDEDCNILQLLRACQFHSFKLLNHFSQR